MSGVQVPCYNFLCWRKVSDLPSLIASLGKVTFILTISAISSTAALHIGIVERKRGLLFVMLREVSPVQE